MSAENYSLEQLNGIVSLTEALAKNPETREQFLRLTKKANPGLNIPEIDAKDDIFKQLESEREERKKLELKIQEQEIRKNIEDQRNLVRAKYSLSDSDLESVEKLMVDKGIPNFETGAEYFSMSQKAAQSTASPAFSASRKFEMPGGDVWGKTLFNSGALRDTALDEAHKAFQEIRGKQ